MPSKAALKLKQSASFIDAGLAAMIRDFELGGASIEGGLTVDGHDTWWILEYGSSPASPGVDLGGDVPLIEPAGLPAPQFHSEPYLIRPKTAIGPNGRPRWLGYFNGRGKFTFKLQTRHPGVHARGFVRAAVRQMQLQLQKELQALAEEDTLPDRSDIVDVVNRCLLDLLNTVRATTPVGSGLQDKSPREGGKHLRDAWGISMAV